MTAFTSLKAKGHQDQFYSDQGDLKSIGFDRLLVSTATVEKPLIRKVIIDSVETSIEFINI